MHGEGRQARADRVNAQLHNAQLPKTPKVQLPTPRPICSKDRVDTTRSWATRQSPAENWRRAGGCGRAIRHRRRRGAVRRVRRADAGEAAAADPGGVPRAAAARARRRACCSPARPAPYYDIAADIAPHGLTDHVTLTGYLDTDESLTDHLAACDVTLNLRWPTARETSGPWLRALAAGRATIITDLVHLGGCRPRSIRGRGRCTRSGSGSRGSGIGSGRRPEAAKAANRPLNPSRPRPIPICVAIDILDEDHSLRLAMRRLAADAALRDALGRAARDWWARDHSVEAMADDYERVMREAAGAARPGRRAARAHARRGRPQAGDADDPFRQRSARAPKSLAEARDHHAQRRSLHARGRRDDHRSPRAARHRPARRRRRAATSSWSNATATAPRRSPTGDQIEIVNFVGGGRDRNRIIWYRIRSMDPSSSSPAASSRRG